MHPSWCLAGIVGVFIAYNLVLFWYAADHAPELMGPVLTGALIIEAHLFAIWAALGPGKFLLRLPPVVAVFLTVLGAPAVHPDGQFERGEFMAIALTGTSIFAITTLLLLIVQRFVGWRIDYREPSWNSDASRYRFNTWYLIALITLYATALGVYTNIDFKPPEPPGLFGPDFVIAIIVYGGATMAALLLPIIAVPLLVLSDRRSKRGLIVALTLWAVITVGVVAFWHVMDDKGSELLEMLLWSILLQVGGVLMALVTAVPLRWAGYRLISGTAPASIVSISAKDE